MNVEPMVERWPVRQCPFCHRTWLADWDYCGECVVWLHETARTEPVVRLVAEAWAGPSAMPLIAEEPIGRAFASPDWMMLAPGISRSARQSGAAMPSPQRFERTSSQRARGNPLYAEEAV